MRDWSVTGAGAWPALPATRALRPAYALPGAVAAAASTGETSRVPVTSDRESRAQNVVGDVGANDIFQLPSAATGAVPTVDVDVVPTGRASNVTTFAPSGSAVPVTVSALPARTRDVDDGLTSVAPTFVKRLATYPVTGSVTAQAISWSAGPFDD